MTATKTPRFLINHPQRSGLYIAFGLVEGDCEAAEWVDRRRADTFSADEIGQVIGDLAAAGHESLLIETVEHQAIDLEALLADE